MRTIAILCTISFLSSAEAAVLVIDDFESESIGAWGGGANSVSANGGPTGSGDAFLNAVSNGGGGPLSRLAIMNTSSDWSGNFQALGLTGIQVDMMNPVSGSPLEMRIVLLHDFANAAQEQRWTSTTSFSLPNDGAWHRAVFSVDQADLSRVRGFGSFNETITDVRGILIRHDTAPASAGGTVVAASVGFDNIALLDDTVVPEPSSFALICLAAPYWICRRRRKS